MDSKDVSRWSTVMSEKIGNIPLHSPYFLDVELMFEVVNIQHIEISLRISSISKAVNLLFTRTVLNQFERSCTYLLLQQKLPFFVLSAFSMEKI